MVVSVQTHSISSDERVVRCLTRAYRVHVGLPVDDEYPQELLPLRDNHQPNLCVCIQTHYVGTQYVPPVLLDELFLSLLRLYGGDGRIKANHRCFCKL